MPAPFGNQNAKKKPWQDAIRRAIAQNKTPDVLFKLATNLVEKALADGDQFAIKELSDRLDGKAVQSTELTGAEGGPLEFADKTPAELKAAILAAQADPNIKAFLKEEK